MVPRQCPAMPAGTGIAKTASGHSPGRRRLVRGWSERSNRPPAAAVDRRNPAGFLLIDRTGRFGPGPGSESRLMYTLTLTRVVTGTQGVRVTVAP